VVLHADSHADRIFDGLTSGAGLAAVIVSGVAGAATLLFVVRSRFELARQSAALAVAAVIAGWAFAQRPDLLPGLPVQEGAAGDATIVAILVSTALGAVILVPSLAFLFGLVLRGRFDEEQPSVDGAEPAPVPGAGPRRALPAAVGLLVVGLPLALLGEGVVLGIGFAALAAFVAVGAIALLDPARLSGEEGRGPAR
jgi:cytochrome bd ubiquinol oxidase subunit II